MDATLTSAFQGNIVARFYLQKRQPQDGSFHITLARTETYPDNVGCFIFSLFFTKNLNARHHPLLQKAGATIA